MECSICFLYSCCSSGISFDRCRHCSICLFVVDVLLYHMLCSAFWVPSLNSIVILLFLFRFNKKWRILFLGAANQCPYVMWGGVFYDFVYIKVIGMFLMFSSLIFASSDIEYVSNLLTQLFTSDILCSCHYVLYLYEWGFCIVQNRTFVIPFL
jgi:hypothetical protein